MCVWVVLSDVVRGYERNAVPSRWAHSLLRKLGPKKLNAQAKTGLTGGLFNPKNFAIPPSPLALRISPFHSYSRVDMCPSHFPLPLMDFPTLMGSDTNTDGFFEPDVTRWGIVGKFISSAHIQSRV